MQASKKQQIAESSDDDDFFWLNLFILTFNTKMSLLKDGVTRDLLKSGCK